MKIKLAALGAAAATVAVLTGGLTTPAASAPQDVVEIQPSTLARGADPQIAFQDRKRILDGDVRVYVDVKNMWLVGESGEDYLILTWGSGNRYQIRLVDPDGNLTLLRRGGPVLASAVLSGDGSRFATVQQGRRRSTVRVYDATDGTLQASRVVAGVASVLDLDDRRVVLGTWGPNRTLSWNTTTDRRRILVEKVGYAASIEADRVAWYTRDPYRRGRSVVATLSDTDTRLWRSRSLRVAEFSADGGHLATIALLSDGIGPSEVQVREVDGTVLDKYRAVWFGRIAFEDSDTVLLHVFGKRKAAIVRCTDAVCERASRLRRAVP
ncbi:hypothetical protein [Nocardioides sp.]|uniref:hypothetical protein n=1 Tax=Nocardioides sp. TaxID=35761 RepID=UPI002ED4D28A